VLRRIGHRQSPFSPDKKHLHHRMLEIGHTHRRAVLLLYFWSALLAFGGVAFSIMQKPWMLVAVLGGLAVVGLLMSVVPRRHRRSPVTTGRPQQPLAAPSQTGPPAATGPPGPAAPTAPTANPGVNGSVRHGSPARQR
jgi:UDP-GlcNAc:undecaprenyl-phosphate/decaprenyl-phosphate GlcNAc-1-phosphate transferase